MKMNFKQNNIKLAIATGLVIGSASFTLPAFADENATTADMDVTASIAVACTLETVDVAFGTYDALGVNKIDAKKASGKITATCTSGASGKITIGEGANKFAGEVGGSSPGLPKRRLMTAQTPNDGQSKYLNYSLHITDDINSAQWNDVAGDTYTSAGSAIEKVVYGFIPGNQTTAMVGSYTDKVSVKIYY